MSIESAHGIETIERPALLAVQLARTPRIAMWFSYALLIGFLVLPVVLICVPWTQTVHGTGQAIAFNPVLRPQFVVSPIEGRVKQWQVVEGQHVETGQLIVEMIDNDPNLVRRLLDEELAIQDRLRAAEGRVVEISGRIRNLENSRQLASLVQGSILRQEQARWQAFKQDEIEAKAALDAAAPNYVRQKGLFESKLGGLASKRDLELATQALETAQARLSASRERVQLGEAAVSAAENGLKKVEADMAAMINLERASQRSAEGDVAIIRRDKLQIETRIARQGAQNITSPCNGTVYRLLANSDGGGLLVRPGERLAILVPDIPLQSTLKEGDFPGIVVELQIDGNDLPLVQKGDRVRLQFEGWPAVQFVGWPSVAVGTFGGRVYMVDPTANDKGQFRILVEPDPLEQPWPEHHYLRQGVRGQGWVLLEMVPLGWEFWRQVNGFPAARNEQQKDRNLPLGPIRPKAGK